jgi:hypothetical protein
VIDTATECGQDGGKAFSALPSFDEPSPRLHHDRRLRLGTGKSLTSATLRTMMGTV